MTIRGSNSGRARVLVRGPIRVDESEYENEEHYGIGIYLTLTLTEEHYGIGINLTLTLTEEHHVI